MNGASLRLSFLLHFHQPHYVDEAADAALLPWVRLHAVKGYYDVPWVLERFPQLRLTLNVTPVLLLQLERYLNGSLTDVYERLSRIPPRDLSAAERRFVVKNFFSIQPGRVREVPRYWELFHKRAPFHDEPERAAGRYTDEEMGDLQCLFNLVWMGFGARADEPFVRELLERGRGYTQEERLSLLDLQRTVAARAVDKIRGLAASGQVEISTSPLFHPILPLLHDTEVTRRVSPERPPPPRFSHPEDLSLHLGPAADVVERALGVRPVGLWPSEGSVSPEILPAVEAAGFRWLATDEHILLKSLPAGAHPRATLYRPYRAGGLSLVFRDKPLADCISFDYAHWDPHAAVEDFMARLGGIAGLDHGGPALVTVAYDGENPWEGYPDGGRGFLEGVAARLDGGPVSARTVGEAIAELPEGDHLETLGSGSWIRGTFEIWAGKPQKNAAWGVLARTRDLLRDKLAGCEVWGDDEGARLLRSLGAAEGSDWFWWYDDDFFSLHKDLFDYLFRRHQANALALAGEPPPEYLRTSLLAPLEYGAHHEPPRTLVQPRIDGAISDYFEWEGAGLYRCPYLDSLLRARVPPLEGFRYGFDEHTLYLRYDYGQDGGSAGRDLLARWRIAFGEERFLVHPFSGAAGEPEVRGPRGGSSGRLGAFAQGTICELALPRAELGIVTGTTGTLDLELTGGGRTLQTLPVLTTLAIAAPDPRTIASMWVA